MSAETKKYRLITRSDMDGLVCAVLLKELGMLETIKFVHPKDVQDGKIPVTGDDITTNLPYMAGAHLAFDHHFSETMRVQGSPANHIIEPNADSTARVLYNHFGGAKTFPRVPEALMAAVDKADSARFTLDEVLNPSDWVLLNFLMDPRTGLGRFKSFRISNYDLMMALVDYCRDHTIEQILALPDVRERVDLYVEMHEPFKEQIQRCGSVHDKLVVLDLRQEDVICAGNRFMVYALFPQCNISLHVLWGLHKQNTSFAVGRSIFDRSSTVNIGEMMLEYGGGGHAAAGTCQVDNDKADFIKKELISRLG